MRSPGYSCMETEGDDGQDDIIVVAADEEDVVLTKVYDLSNFIVVKENKASSSKDKKSGSKQLFENVKKPVILFMKKDVQEDMSKAPIQKALGKLQSEVSLLKITEKLSRDDLLDMNKYSYDMDDQNMFEQRFQQQVAAGSS